MSPIIAVATDLRWTIRGFVVAAFAVARGRITAVIEVYTDGACKGNPGPGGWGWVVPDGPWANGGEAESTNQRMELMAVLDALRSLPGRVEVVSFSS
jgi:hypothetical protein